MTGEQRHWWWQRPYLFVGRIAGDKGVTHIIRAWLALRDRLGADCPPLWLTGGLPEEIEAARASLGWPSGPTDEERDDRLVWWGYMDPPGISALLSRVSVVVMHSRYEPGGRVVLEAMAQGVPVIATPFGFAADLVRDWQTGFLVAFGDHDGLTARMAHFASQPLLRHVLGADARRLALGSLRQWDFLGAHEAVYEQAVAGVPAAPPRGPTDADMSGAVLFRRREVPPLYPFGETVPSDEAVRSLVETTTGQAVASLVPVTSGPGSSRLWRATAAGETWIVKWPYPRLSRHVLWSDMPPRDLLTSGQERFQRDRHSGTLPGFVPWDGIDSDARLLMRRQRAQPTRLDADTVALAAAAFRRLGATPFEGVTIAEWLARDWRRATRSEVLEGHQGIVSKLTGGPWDRGRLFSARMAWRLLELDMEGGRLPVGLSLPSDYQARIALFSDLAASEDSMPVTVVHGSGDLEHCLWLPDGSLGLIDGEHIHPAIAGEDTAALIHCAVAEGLADPAGAVAWPALLEAATRDEEEQARVLSWLGYLAMEAVFKNAVLINPEAHAMALRHLDELTRLARSLFSR